MKRNNAIVAEFDESDNNLFELIKFKIAVDINDKSCIGDKHE